MGMAWAPIDQDTAVMSGGVVVLRQERGVGVLGGVIVLFVVGDEV